MSALVGAYLATHRLLRGELRQLAELVHKSARTLRKWRARVRAGTSARLAHRPRAPAPTAAEESQASALWRTLVRGHDGSRTLLCKLGEVGIALARRAVQALVRRFKREREREARLGIEARRVHTLVLARDALWSGDESFLGRDEREETRALALFDPGVSRTLWSSVGPPAKADDLVRALERTAEERAAWPLVVLLDNGKVNHSHALKRLLDKHQVIALYNVPHTPQHNAFVERAFCDLKLASGLEGHGVRIVDPSKVCASVAENSATREQLQERLMAARAALDDTPRERLGGLTPAQIDSLLPRAEDLACRARFYTDARAALESVARLQLAPRARRRAEREAILCTLERHGLVVRTRGNGRSSRPSMRTSLA